MEMRQHDPPGVWHRDAAAGLARGAGVGDQAAAGAAAHRRNGERRDEREAQPAAVGAGEPSGRDRDANMRLAVDQQSGGQREEPREYHLTTKCAALPCTAGAQVCVRPIYRVMAASPATQLTFKDDL